MILGDSEKISKRKFSRADFRGIISFEFPDTDKESGCVSQDIGGGGLRVNVENFVKPNTPVKIKFRLTPNAEPIAFEGRVAWANKLPASDRYHLGIEFTSLNDEGAKKIQQYISERPAK